MWSLVRAVTIVASLATLAACDSRPLTPGEIEAQHRFQTGCRAVDAQGYEMNMPYCGHNGGRDH